MTSSTEFAAGIHCSEIVPPLPSLASVEIVSPLRQLKSVLEPEPMLSQIAASGGMLRSCVRKLGGTTGKAKRHRAMYTMSVATSTVPFPSTSIAVPSASMFELIVVSGRMAGLRLRKLAGTDGRASR
jgi:hypothetical protein